MSVIVYGPPMCGKTKNAEVLKKHFGLDHVIDDFTHDMELPSRTLALTNDASYICQNYFDVMAQITNTAIDAFAKCELNERVTGFEFELGQLVVHEDQKAKITARVEYLDEESENLYFLHYDLPALNSTGENIWIPESDIYDDSQTGEEHDEVAEAVSQK